MLALCIALKKLRKYRVRKITQQKLCNKIHHRDVLCIHAVKEQSFSIKRVVINCYNDMLSVLPDYINCTSYVLSLVFLPKVGNPNWNEIIDVT